MARHADSATGDNVIYLFGARQKSREAELAHAPAAAGEIPTPSRTRKEEVFFIREGLFRCMVNGAVGMVRPGDFVRVGEGIAHAFRDVGTRPGLMFSHAFPIGVDARLLNEIGVAIPVSAREFPKAGTPEFCALCAIAIRWGVRLDDNDAAA
jgi:mannose-6-phosphate isomerase-like protein (cupin superfamily)